MRKGALFLLLGACLAFTAPSVMAQSKKLPKSEQAKVDASEKAAKEHFKLHEYQEALDSFKEAYRISNNPKFQIGMGQTYRKMKRYEDALFSFRLYLKEGTDPDLKADLEENLIPAVEEILNQGSVSVSANEEQAEVYIDGTKKGELVGTSLVVSELAPGKHSIEIKKEGFEIYLSTFTLDIRQKLSLKIFLEALPGSLSVSTTPTQADIFVDGERKETFPIPLPPGVHRLSLVKKGFQRYNTEITITPGGELSVQHNLEIAKGTLDVSANVPNAEVLLDGKKVGKISIAGEFSMPDIPVGEHEVAVHYRSFQEFRQTFTLIEDSPQKIRANLVSERGPKIAYGVAATTGVEGLGIGGVSLSLILKAKARRRPPLFQSEVENAQTQLRVQQTVRTAKVAGGLIGVAIVSGALGYGLSRRAKSKQSQVSKTSAQNEASLLVED
jgi:hypothetical protein